jgi:hypothetical protein
MKRLFYSLLGITLSLTLAGCGSNSKPSEPAGPTEHVHQINECGDCATCGEYLGTYPTLFPVRNTVPALKTGECYFTRFNIYAGHKYCCDHLSDYSDYTYEETYWYGHNSEGYTLLATNQYSITVDEEGKIDGKTYDAITFKVMANVDHANPGDFDYYIYHDKNHLDDVDNCMYDNIFLGVELQLGVLSIEGVDEDGKIHYRFHIEDGKAYFYDLETSGDGEIKFYYTVGEHRYEETDWKENKPKVFLSKDDYIYIVASSSHEDFGVAITVSEATE